jgi:sugar lactone lactonase YvrE
MRKVVAYSLAAALALAGLLLPATSSFSVAHAQQAAPEIRRLGPETITAGSPSFTIRLEGRNFAEGATVLFDNVPLGDPRVFSRGKLLLAEVDASLVAAPGTHTVRAVNPDGSSSAPETLTVVTQDEDLRIRLGGNAAEEDSGTGFEFNVDGEGFDEDSVAFIWGRRSPSTQFVSPTRLRVQIPERFTSNPARIPIVVRNSTTEFSNVEIFFIVPRRARLESVEPESIEVGSENFTITVRGNFKPDAVIVVNGERLETTVVREGSRLEATVPASLRSQPGILVVRVEQDGIQSLDQTIAVTPSSDPFIFATSPSRIRIGERRPTIEIEGANFNDDVEVLIDGQEVDVRDSNRRRITVRVPEGLLDSVGSHTIQVQSGENALSNVASFSVVPDVTVSTLAGAREGFNDPEEARCVSGDDALFRRPRRLSFGPDGLLYVTDQQNHAIRTIDTLTGEVCTLAGTGQAGYNDSGNPRGFEPSFSFPNGVAIDAAGVVYVTENGNNVVRRIVRGAGDEVTVDTFAGARSEINSRDRQNRLNSTRDGLEGFRDGPATNAAFRLPDDIVIAADGTIYLADPLNHSVRRIRQEGGQLVVETIAGNGVPGFADGIAVNARFNTPTALVLSDDGRFLFVADTLNERIRQIDLLTMRVTTFAGSGESGDLDGPGSTASFRQPIGLALDEGGVLYVSEFAGDRIRVIDASGNVNTLAGNDSERFREGPGLRATFSNPRGLAIDRARGILYVADYENSRVRAIALR